MALPCCIIHSHHGVPVHANPTNINPTQQFVTPYIPKSSQTERGAFHSTYYLIPLLSTSTSRVEDLKEVYRRPPLLGMCFEVVASRLPFVVHRNSPGFLRSNLRSSATDCTLVALVVWCSWDCTVQHHDPKVFVPPIQSHRKVVGLRDVFDGQ